MFRKTIKSFSAALLLSVSGTLATSTLASGDCMIGEVKMFAGNFAPRSWALTNGQLLPINQNQALFSILGTTYGGDGRTSFGLPDLRGRAAVGTGQGPGLTNRRLGQKFGSETATVATTKAGGKNKGKQVVLLGGTPIPVAGPSLVINHIICLQGTFPSRS